MIARDTGGGGSFHGAGLYCLHDRNAGTDERVAFTHTENLLTDDPEKALKVMAWTAQHQADLKRAAGVKATGRKLASPVHTFVFSWAQGEEPDAAHMVETAKSAMEALGLAEHEALYIGHDDTSHHHVHVIVNRVNPHHGKAATLSKSHLALSKWAEDYEREHGIHCHRRIENNARRQGGQRIIDRESRRRNAEQFADWRGDRRRAATAAHEQRRFRDWADRRRGDLQSDQKDRLRQLERLQDTARLLTEDRLARTYDTSADREKLKAVESSLAVGGVKGLWHRLTGRRSRDVERKEALEKNIANAQQRHQEGLQGLSRKLQAEKDQLFARERERAQALEIRIGNAMAQREREGWRSMKAELPRDVQPAREQDNVAEFMRLQAQWQEKPRDRGPERGR